MVNRRDFLRTAAGTAAGVIGFPCIIPSYALGKSGAVSPSNKLTMGCIGVGWMGTSNMEAFLEEPDVRIVAVCDVDSTHLNAAVNTVNKKYGSQDCAAYRDFRQLLARNDIDIVSLGLPDHWHSIPAIMAARAGKDIYGEKPLSHTLREGRAMCDAVRQYGRVWQTGSWQRSRSVFQYACELVLNGRIGKVHTVEVGLPEGFSDYMHNMDQQSPMTPPEVLDYDFWLGPAPYEPYCPARVHKNWRWNLDYGGGQLMDWVGHHVDIAHWGMGLQYTGPVEIEGKGEYPQSGLWNTALKYYIKTKYANGIDMIIAGGYPEIRFGTKWIGDRGWIWVERSGIDASPKSLLNERISPEEIHLPHYDNHYRNFLDRVKDRGTTVAPCEVAHRSATPGHLAQISMLLGRKLKFDPQTEQIIDDPQACRMLGKAMRSPWTI